MTRSLPRGIGSTSSFRGLYLSQSGRGIWDILLALQSQFGNLFIPQVLAFKFLSIIYTSLVNHKSMCFPIVIMSNLVPWMILHKNPSVRLTQYALLPSESSVPRCVLCATSFSYLLLPLLQMLPCPQNNQYIKTNNQIKTFAGGR
jgi:hypothetical protein